MEESIFDVGSNAGTQKRDKEESSDDDELNPDFYKARDRRAKSPKRPRFMAHDVAYEPTSTIIIPALALLAEFAFIDHLAHRRLSLTKSIRTLRPFWANSINDVHLVRSFSL